ncbi:MAG TPA: HypC/HybG/HupF family hydrogenase formation chaperone [Candidatus Margulisiibacteriota bacterium]|nr:HypC/HybG/HupF family hydrogenase formation chaperone [Candidatus Margulisiibacteriota bacterium]
MCLAVPMKIIKVAGDFAEVESSGLKKRVNTQMLSGIREGDYVMVHAGFAIQRIDSKMAQETLKLLHEIR